MERTLNDYLDNIKSKINDRLEEYMSAEGISMFGSNFRCPNTQAHAHGDEHPSAGIFDDHQSGQKRWHCLTCNVGVDTIALSHYHEGLPITGAGFIDTTIPSLCKKLGIEYDVNKALSPEQREIASMYRANEIVAEAAKENLTREINKPDSGGNPNVLKFFEHRKLTVDDIQRFDIGMLEIEDAVKVLIDNNIPANIRKEICVDQQIGASRRIFRKDSIIFTLRTESGRACGFAARNLLYGTADDKGAKYINISNNRVFKKGAHLYGMHTAKAHILSENQAYIFEGYMDRITATKAGLENCVAICGVSFTDEHLDTIRELGISGIVFAPDSDKAGREAAHNIEKLFSEYKISTPFIMEMPAGEDPDSLIRFTQSLDDFNAIPRYSIVQYKIKTTFNKANTNEMHNVEEEIEKFFQWLIEYEPHHIRRLRCLDMLVEYTGLSHRDLRKQLEYQDKVMSQEVAKKVDNLWYDMLRNGKTAVLKERIDIIDSARIELSKLIAEDNEDVIRTQITSINEVEEEFKTSTITSIKFGWPQFDKNILIPKAASLVIVGAYPNVGKSIFMRAMALRIIERNRDMGVIYFSMDDPKKSTLPALIANMCKVPINDIRYQMMLSPESRETRLPQIDTGFKRFREMVNESRFALFDQNDVMTIGDIETQIDICGEKMSKKKLKPVVVIDSLHSIANPVAAAGIRQDIMFQIRSAKRISNTRDIPVLTVAELRKGQGHQTTTRSVARPPKLRDIAESIDIEYRVMVGIMLHNELLVSRDTTQMYWHHPHFRGVAQPIVETIIEKNKEGYFKGSLFMKMNSFYSAIDEASVDEMRTYRSNDHPPLGNQEQSSESNPASRLFV